MGKRGTYGAGSVDARKRSIRLRFTVPGLGRVTESLDLMPTQGNMTYAKQLLAQIQAKIADKSFVYADFFPQSPRATHFPLPGSVGLIYVIRQAETGAVKVGYTKDLKRLRTRIVSLQGASPYALALLRYFPGTMALEREIHHACRTYALRAKGGVEDLRGKARHYIGPGQAIEGET
jgi:hypothetical protein